MANGYKIVAQVYHQCDSDRYSRSHQMVAQTSLKSEVDDIVDTHESPTALYWYVAEVRIFFCPYCAVALPKSLNFEITGG